MNYPCEIIRDLLPLYIDGVCNHESRQAVEKHLTECEACRKYYESMKTSVSLSTMEKNISVDLKAINSLKKVKNQLNRKINRIWFGAAAVLVVILSGIYLLFFAPIVNVSAEDISVFAEVYEANKLLETYTPGTWDVHIPEHGLTLTASSVAKFSHVSVVSITSDCFLRHIEKEVKDNTLYITALKTTLLNNSGVTVQSKLCELAEIDRIVFVDNSGSESILWNK